MNLSEFLTVESSSASSHFGSRIYLDANATTPLAQVIQEKIPGWLGHWGNPSSIHLDGRGPKSILREARQSLASMMGCHPLEVVFTSGGSEANNLALKGYFENLVATGSFQPGKTQFISTRIEHPSVTKTLQYLETRGVRVDWINVDREGNFDFEQFQSLLSEDTALVSVMLANNETGSLLPIKRISEMAHRFKAVVHSDCVQGFGKVPVNFADLGVDMASISAHKFYSLKGSGALIVKRGVILTSLIHGGGQERHRRAGTENLLAIAALGEMTKFQQEVVERQRAVACLRDYFESEVSRRMDAVQFNGRGVERLPNTSSLVIDKVDGEVLLMNLDMEGFSVSTGAACSSGSPEPSPVLRAMGLSHGEAQSSLRVSLCWSTTKEDIERFLETLERVVLRIRALAVQERAQQEVSL